MMSMAETSNNARFPFTKTERVCSNGKLILSLYHTSNSRERMGVNGEALQLHTVYKKPYFLLQVTLESISVLQVTRESVSVLQVM